MYVSSLQLRGWRICWRFDYLCQNLNVSWLLDTQKSYKMITVGKINLKMIKMRQSWEVSLKILTDNICSLTKKYLTFWFPLPQLRCATSKSESAVMLVFVFFQIQNYCLIYLPHSLYALYHSVEKLISAIRCEVVTVVGAQACNHEWGAESEARNLLVFFMLSEVRLWPITGLRRECCDDLRMLFDARMNFYIENEIYIYINKQNVWS